MYLGINASEWVRGLQKVDMVVGTLNYKEKQLLRQNNLLELVIVIMQSPSKVDIANIADNKT